MAQFQVPGGLPAAIALDPSKAQRGPGNEFRYLDAQSQPRPVRYQQMDLYYESTWLVTHNPAGELLNGGLFVQWNTIALQPQQGYFDAVAGGGQTLQWSATALSPLPVIERVALAGLVPSIGWGGPYCTRGWISSLLPTVSCRGTVTWRGRSVTIGQNRHEGGNLGSAWLEGVAGADVKPSGMPNAWSSAVSGSMPDGTGRDDFKAEITFSQHLKDLGANPIDRAGESVRLNRWRVLYLKYADDIAKAPGGQDALETMRSNPPTQGTKYELN